MYEGEMWGVEKPGLLKVGRISGLTQTGRQRDGGESAANESARKIVL